MLHRTVWTVQLAGLQHKSTLIVLKCMPIFPHLHRPLVLVYLSDSCGCRFSVRIRRWKECGYHSFEMPNWTDCSAGLRDKSTSQFVTLKSMPISFKSSACPCLLVRIRWLDAAAIISVRCRIGLSGLFSYVHMRGGIP